MSSALFDLRQFSSPGAVVFRVQCQNALALLEEVLQERAPTALPQPNLQNRLELSER